TRGVALAQHLQPRLSDAGAAQRAVRADVDDRRLREVDGRDRGRPAHALGSPRAREPDEDRHRHPRRRRGPGGGQPHGDRRQPDHLAHVPHRRRDGGRRRRVVRSAVQPDQSVYRLHPGPESLHRGRPGRHRQHSRRHARRDRARAPGGFRGLLHVAAHGRGLRRRVQGHLRLLRPDPDPDLPSQGPARRSGARARVIPSAAAVAFVALSTAAVALFPRSILVFLVFQTSLLYAYVARIPGWLRAALLAAALLVLMPAIGAYNGYYLAIVTLGFGEVIRVLANNLDKPINVTNGPRGITPISRPPLPVEVSYAVGFYFLVLLIVVVVILVNRRLEDSHIGRAWEAMREDQLAAQAMGVPLVRAKLLAFAAGASFAGVMGVVFSAKQVFINPESFTFLESIGVLAMVILGGMGSIPGAIIGATVVTVLNLQVLKGLSLWLNELKNAGVTILGYNLAGLPTQLEPAKYERMIFGLI